MKFSPSIKRYYPSDAEASSVPADAFDMSDVQEAFLREKQAAGYIVRYEDGEFIAYHPDNPPLDIVLRNLRMERDSLLAQCDWTQGRDSPLSEEQIAAWADYRQALRDLPEASTDPRNPTWPTRPE